ncbi:putative Cell division coordinator CpoB [Candidatus Desulfarcum epimagneticum]|uniref:Putative Cell division coordinator CpoB n=1 Tax=uncultured Desulfobacteraceae bacterium TaxID=218296 RepID=A0A484HIZ5_9BACT|nr:putative Cell division coordinator CpoB [uncultured Desulfobacteraceae bacterium]
MNMKKKQPRPARLLFFSALAAIACLSGCKSLNQRIERIETLSLANQKENQGLKTLLNQRLADLSRADQINDDLRRKSAGTRADLAQIIERAKRLAGRMDELEHHVSNELNSQRLSLESALSRMSGLSREIGQGRDRFDLFERRTREFEKETRAALKRLKTVRAAPPPVRTTPRPSKTDAPKTGSLKTASSKSKMKDKAVYALAKKAFDKGDLEAAKKGFLDFLKNRPNSYLAGNCQFWLGEIHYREKKYEKAIVAYQNVLEKYPSSNKASSSLLKQGYAFIKLKDRPNAFLFLNEVIRRFPGSREARIAEKKLKSIQ